MARHSRLSLSSELGRQVGDVTIRDVSYVCRELAEGLAELCGDETAAAAIMSGHMLADACCEEGDDNVVEWLIRIGVAAADLAATFMVGFQTEADLAELYMDDWGADG